MTSEHAVPEVLRTILSLAYIPALLVLCLVSLYYLRPLLRVQSGTGIDFWRRIRLIVSLLVFLLGLGFTLFRMSS